MSIRLCDPWDGDALGYDAWKLRSPDDERQEECWHEEYEPNWEGRATCCQCGHSWWMTAEEIKRERELFAAYDAMMRREERRQWIEGWIRRLTFWRRWCKPKPIDDDVPF